MCTSYNNKEETRVSHFISLFFSLLFQFYPPVKYIYIYIYIYIFKLQYTISLMYIKCQSKVFEQLDFVCFFTKPLLLTCIDLIQNIVLLYTTAAFYLNIL